MPETTDPTDRIANAIRWGFISVSVNILIGWFAIAMAIRSLHP